MTGLLVALCAGIILFFLLKKKKTPEKKIERTHSQAETARVPAERPFDINMKRSCGEAAVLKAPTPAQAAVLKHFSAHIQDIPALPTVWTEIQNAIKRDAPAKDIARIVRQDQGLATEVLKIANSVALGSEKEINDLGQAIVRLGYQAVRGIATNYCTSDFSKRWDSPFSIQQLWRHSMAVSVLSTMTARYIPGCNAGVATTLGLLHDIGRIGLNSLCPAAFQDKPNLEEGFLVYERAHFGCTHVDAGVLLAKHWNLPEALQQGIAYHHHPALGAMEAIPKDIRKEVLAVYLADFLAIHFGFSGGNKLLVEPHPSFAPLVKASLNDIAQDKMISKELLRIKAIDF